MRRSISALGSLLIVLSSSGAARAQDDPWTSDAQRTTSPPAPAARATVAPLANTATPSAPPAPVAAPKEEVGRDAPANDPRAEVNARIGLKMAGEISPVNWFRTETSAAPLLGVDAAWVPIRYFSVGPYVSFSPYSFDRMSGSRKLGEGSGIFFSGGVAAKARLPVSDSFTLRGGLTLGLNIVSYDGKSTESSGTFELSGTGLQVGAVVDGVYRFSPKVGIVGQLGFFAQPTGSASVRGYPTDMTAEGESRKFGFKPIFMASVGPELNF